MKVLNHHSTHTTGAIYMQYTTWADGRQVIQSADILHDETRTGRTVPWHSHKANAMALSYPVEEIDPAAAFRMRRCADRLSFTKDAGGHMQLQQAYFCRVRLCPMCQWRRSLKMHGQVRQCIEWLAADRQRAGHKPYQYILLTLTVPNCPGEALGRTLDLIQDSWKRLQRRAEYKAAIKGNVRCVEITYNRKANTYHPHIHALLAVNPSYFTGRTYVTHDRWLQIWRECTGDPTITQVDVRKTTGDAAAVAEVTKYATKASDVLKPGDVQRNREVVGTLMRYCHKRRFAGWGGVLRKAHQALQLDDVENGDLIHTDNAEEAADTAAPLWSWDWYVGPRLYIAAQKGAANA